LVCRVDALAAGILTTLIAVTHAQTSAASEDPTGAASTHPSSTTENGSLLPPVPVDDLRAKSPQPSWDIGLLAAVCGVGFEGALEAVQFCGGGLADVMFFREKETETGLGAYGQISTAGFRDLRLSAGLSGIISMIDWFSLGLRAGGLMATTFAHSAPGGELFLEFGHRSVSFRSHYAVSHTLVAGLQILAPRGRDPSSQALWLGLRIDGLWLTAPRALFR
jgi:hypothetical protein